MEGERTLGEEGTVAAIHIPSGGKLTTKACLASFPQAREGFGPLFPGERAPGGYRLL